MSISQAPDELEINREIYSFESYLYDFWILEAGKLFFEKYYFF